MPADEIGLTRTVQRLLSACNRLCKRAEQAAAAEDNHPETLFLSLRLRRTEQEIAEMKPGPGYTLTPEGQEEMNDLKADRRKLQRRLQDARKPQRERADSLRTMIGRVIQTEKRLGRLETEREQLEAILGVLPGLDDYVYANDQKALDAARARLAELDRQAEAAVPEAVLEPEPDYGSLVPLPTDLEIDPEGARVIERLNSGNFDPSEDYDLNQAAQRLSLISGFEDLICLPLVHGVEHYPFQIHTALQVLRTMRGRALLCDEVGLGKTIEAGLVLKEYLVRGLARKILILAPPALVLQWRDEMQDKFGISFATHNDPQFRTLGAEAWERQDRVIASLHTARSSPHREAIQAIPYDVLIVDEAHHLKSRTTASWKFVNGIKSRCSLLLTATPVQNNLDELFNLITLLSPGQLHTAQAFRREFVERGNPRRPRNQAKLRELLMGVMVRNTRSQVSVVLPPRRAHTLRLTLSPAERRLYDASSEFVRAVFRGGHTERFLAQTLQMEAGSSVQALRATLENMSRRHGKPGPSLDALLDLAGSVDGSTKITGLLDLLRRHDEKTLVFTRYRETQKAVLNALEQAGISGAQFGGHMNTADKDEQVAAFAAERQVMVSTDVGSEGRNLQFCHTLVNYDLPWNPMVIEQRVGRVHRIGQTEAVNIYNLCARDTVEDYVLEVLDSKINMFELVVGEVGEILGNLDEERDFEDTVLELWAGADSTESARAAFDRLGEDLARARRRFQEAQEYDQALFGEEFVAEEI